MKLYIKNMVCSRCKMVVKAEFEKLEIEPISVELGEVELTKPITETEKATLLQNLQALGFDLIDDKKSKTIDKIKTLIIELVHHQNNELKTNLSDYLAQELHQDYNSLSNLFSEVENNTIEKYFINQKIEKVKELIIYNELSLSEIADMLNYSNVAHLSNQFKKVTGFTPTYFKNLKDKKRIQIENL
ncbi:helix-turn-helix domain-containing protein [Flavobacterium sp. GA093]|uniref:Helix-turn-helix domain-containing protein n=1 Tax=Flavobacterium hydrocarbonoxydans TaxID=2683249 RepID=A0A6I4NJF3_9FLAO|nr:AraC family transcriptional regulator [Flavobacterium hydrocarbonoxydans]MWB94626.1 helix-turn-helix domain-containing protein [Flavobacterium hydrocarbonoxydans]